MTPARACGALVALVLCAASALHAKPPDPAAAASSAASAAAGKPPVPVPYQRMQDLNLAVGETETLSARGVLSFSEGIKGVVDVRLTPDKSQFIVVGQRPGSTTLLLLHQDEKQITYSINVFSRPVASVERELLELLDGIKGIRVRQVGGRFFVEGEVARDAIANHVARIAAFFPGQVESLVTVGSGVKQEVNIRIDFIYVHFNRSKSYQVGISWPTRFAGPGIASLDATQELLGGAATQARASVVDQPLPGLDLATSKGWAKVLKHSTVISASGSQAKFSSGGEQNYITSTGFSAQLSQITFGTDISVLPLFDAVTGEVQVKLEAEVMDLTPPVSSGTNLPGRNVSKLSTNVALKLGQSVVLSGIRSRSQRHSVDGLPLLSEIPVLGLLFASHRDNEEDVDGAIFVIPSVIEAVPHEAQEMVDEALRDYEAFSGDMRGIDAKRYSRSKLIDSPR